MLRNSLIFQAGGSDNNLRNPYGHGVDLSYSFTLELEIGVSKIQQIGPSLRISSFTPIIQLSTLEDLMNSHGYLLHWIAEVRYILMRAYIALYIVFNSTDIFFKEFHGNR